MPFYIGENKIVDRYVGDKLVIAAYKGESKYFDAYSEITGIFPIIFKSRAAVALKNYLLHGSSEGAGVETVNLCDCTTFAAGHLDGNGNIVNASSTTYVNGLPDGSIEFTTSAWRGVHTEKFLIPTGATKILFYYQGAINNNQFRFAFYDSNGDFVSQSTQSGGYSFTITIPAGAVSVAIGIQLSTSTTYKYTKLQLYTDLDTVTAFIPYGYKLPLTVTSGETENLFDKDATDTENGYEQEKYIAYGGAVASNSAWNVSEYIEVDSNTVYTCAHVSAGMAAAAVGCYDVNKRYINTSSTFNSESIVIFTTGNDVKYVRISFRTDYKDTAMLVKGSTVPDHYIPHRYTSTYPLYIGSTKLGAEEYVDYGEQKVYKRTENFYDPNATDKTNGFNERRYLNSSGSSASSLSWNISEYIEVNPNTDYTFVVYSAGYSPSVCEYDENKKYITGTSYNNAKTVSITTNALTKYIQASIYVPRSSEIMFVQGSTPPDHYIPYLQPTDPPVPFPPISTYQGENTLSSTETVGEATIKGRINELPTQQPDN